MYTAVRENLLYIPLAMMFLVGAASLLSVFLSRNQMIAGSGIPQLKGILAGYFKHRPGWMQTLLLKFAGGVVAIAGGLSLGREGPSIQLGALVAEGVGNRIGKSRIDRKILIASGASAGLAAAFNAPLAGVVFALEEVFKYFSPRILLSTMTAAVAADFISKETFGIEPIFHFAVVGDIPLKAYWLLLLLGVFTGAAGAFYNRSLQTIQELYGKIKQRSSWGAMMVPFVFAGIAGVFFPAIVCSGHRMVREFDLNTGILLLCLLFILKYLLSMISYCSGAPGGIFFPLLVLGGTIGAIFGCMAVQLGGVEESLFYHFVVLAMAGYFTAIVKAPITGIILISEMTGSFHYLLPLTIVSVVAYVTADLLKTQPVYDMLLERLISKEKVSEDQETGSPKLIIEAVVRHGSFMEEKEIKEIPWPSDALLVSIKRGERELIPKGKTRIKAGDSLLILTNLDTEVSVREEIEILNKVES